MDLLIVSDLHIGSRYFVTAAFEQFLNQMPDDCELVLNGDVIDHPYYKLNSSHRNILDRIKQLSFQQNVIWVVPVMLLTSSVIMAFAWLGHLRFRTSPLAIALLASWFLVIPEYMLNVYSTRLGHGTYTGAQMASLNLCTGVVCVAVVSVFILGEKLTRRQWAGFGLMALAIVLIMFP